MANPHCFPRSPHRSLSRVGFLAVMLIIGGASFATGMMFLIIGAWPVIGFLGLDAALVYWALRANFSTAAAFEEITVTASALRVRKVSHHGKVAEWTLNPVWTKIDRETNQEYDLMRLFLVSHGRKLPLAGFLSPRERESFAAALAAAIGEAKRGLTRA
jgi:uncharacterized membrane protein